MGEGGGGVGGRNGEKPVSKKKNKGSCKAKHADVKMYFSLGWETKDILQISVNGACYSEKQCCFLCENVYENYMENREATVPVLDQALWYWLQKPVLFLIVCKSVREKAKHVFDNETAGKHVLMESL